MNDLPATRGQVLLLSYADQYLEVYTSPGVDAHLLNVPWAVTPPLEYQADEVLLSLLPYRYRELLDARCLRLNGSTRRLTPEVHMDAEVVQKLIQFLNQIPQPCSEEDEEVMQWTL